MRFLSFILVGSIGALIHMSVLWLIHIFLGKAFFYSQIIATLIAMTGTYFMNNHFTYYDKKRTGSDNFKGLINFYIMCSFGAVISVVVADYLYTQSLAWWLAGLLGAVFGAVWNFLSTAIFIWGDGAGTNKG
jgi:dolichol-phosphate mannosyltransferase